jgi:hypothetical protein
VTVVEAPAAKGMLSTAVHPRPCTYRRAPICELTDCVCQAVWYAAYKHFLEMAVRATEMLHLCQTRNLLELKQSAAAPVHVYDPCQTLLVAAGQSVVRCCRHAKQHSSFVHFSTT